MQPPSTTRVGARDIAARLARQEQGRAHQLFGLRPATHDRFLGEDRLLLGRQQTGRKVGQEWPGARQLTVMPKAPRSLAPARVRPINPLFVAEYALRPAAEVRPRIEDTLIIRPHRRSFIGPTSARVSAMHELRLSSTRPSQSSSMICSVGCGCVAAGVVDQDVDPAHRARALRRRAGGTSSRCVISATKWATLHAGARPDIGLRGRKLFFMPAGDDDVGAGLRETAGHGFAKALAASRHKGHASRQIKKLDESSRSCSR